MIILKAIFLTLLATYIAASIFTPDAINNFFVRTFNTTEIIAGKIAAILIVVVVSILLYLIH